MHVLSNDEISKLKMEYEINKVVSFPLFTNEHANNYRNRLLNNIPKEDWEFVSMISGNQSTTKIRWLSNNTQAIVWEWNIIENIRSRPNVFGGRYNQIPDNYTPSVTSEIENSTVVSYLQQVIPDISGIKESIVMALPSGCFINDHTDRNRGKAAYVYQLTKDWHPMYGGVLHFNNNGISVTPSFNRITIMQTGDEGIVHCVTPVADYVKNTRLSVSGTLY